MDDDDDAERGLWLCFLAIAEAAEAFIDEDDVELEDDEDVSAAAA